MIRPRRCVSYCTAARPCLCPRITWGEHVARTVICIYLAPVVYGLSLLNRPRSPK